MMRLIGLNGFDYTGAFNKLPDCQTNEDQIDSLLIFLSGSIIQVMIDPSL